MLAPLGSSNAGCGVLLVLRCADRVCRSLLWATLAIVGSVCMHVRAL
jgi:hypothetical protein